MVPLGKVVPFNNWQVTIHELPDCIKNSIEGNRDQLAKPQGNLRCNLLWQKTKPDQLSGLISALYPTSL